MMNNPVDTKSRRRVIQGKVIGVAGAKSVVLLVERKVVHPKYRKIIRRFKKYTIHDEDSRAKVGDLVNAVECRPMSRTKSFVLKNIVVSGVSE